MHIILLDKELKNISPKILPEETTLIVCGEDEYNTPQKRLVVRGGEFVLLVDFTERDRDFKDDNERKKFEEKISSREFVLDFFIAHEDDDCPQREYSAICDVEYDLFKTISHSGTYMLVDGKRFNNYKIRINKKVKLDVAKEEIKLLISAYRKHFPKLNILTLDIFERTCSEHGAYSLHLYLDNLEEIVAEISKLTWGHESVVLDKTSLDLALKYIKKNLYSDY